MARIRAYVGLGSNLQGPVAQVQQALASLGRLPGTQVIAHSRLYSSAPMGPQDQPDYVNAVAALDTELAPHALLDALQDLEARQGRQRGPQRWGPRTLDLDLLLYADWQLADARLSVPHPGLHERNFVLYPLYELAPDLEIPGRGALRDLVARCPANGLQPLSPQ